MPFFIKNKFFSFPPKIRIHRPGRTNFKWKIKMTSDHDVKNAKEQKDWLKICGVSYSLNARKDSTMLAGRWNPDTKKWEFTIYSHLPNVSLPVYKGPIIAVDIDTEIIVELNVSHDFYTWKIGGEIYYVHHGSKRGWSRQVNPWAGGTLPSPKTYWFVSRLIG